MNLMDTYNLVLGGRDTSQFMVKVYMYDLDGNLVETYETMTDCVKAGYKNAKLVALGRRKVCKGFVFKYLD